MSELAAQIAELTANLLDREGGDDLVRALGVVLEGTRRECSGPTIGELIERSSLGTPEAKAIRGQCPSELVNRALHKVDLHDQIGSALIAAFPTRFYTGGIWARASRLVMELSRRGVVVLAKADYDELVTQRRDFAKIVAAVAPYFECFGIEHEDPGCPEDDSCTCPLTKPLMFSLTTELVKAAQKLVTPTPPEDAKE